MWQHHRSPSSAFQGRDRRQEAKQPSANRLHGKKRGESNRGVIRQRSAAGRKIDLTSATVCTVVFTCNNDENYMIAIQYIHAYYA